MIKNHKDRKIFSEIITNSKSAKEYNKIKFQLHYECEVNVKKVTPQINNKNFTQL